MSISQEMQRLIMAEIFLEENDLFRDIVESADGRIEVLRGGNPRILARSLISLSLNDKDCLLPEILKALLISYSETPRLQEYLLEFGFVICGYSIMPSTKGESID